MKIKNADKTKKNQGAQKAYNFKRYRKTQPKMMTANEFAKNLG